MIGCPVIYADLLKVNVAVSSGLTNSDFAVFLHIDYIPLSSATHSWQNKCIPTEDWRSLNPHSPQAFPSLDKEVKSPEQVNACFALLRLSPETSTTWRCGRCTYNRVK